MFRNHTLAALQGADLAELRPHLHERLVERGEVLTAQGAEVERIFFPTTAYLANMVTFSDGRSAETFVMAPRACPAWPPSWPDSPAPGRWR